MKLTWERTLAVWWSFFWRSALLGGLCGGLLGTLLERILDGLGSDEERSRIYAVATAFVAGLVVSIFTLGMALQKHLVSLYSAADPGGVAKPVADDATGPPAIAISWKSAMLAWWGVLWRVVVMLFLFVAIVDFAAVPVARKLGAGGQGIQETLTGCTPAVALLGSIAALKRFLCKRLSALAARPIVVSWGAALAIWWGMLWRSVAIWIAVVFAVVVPTELGFLSAGVPDEDHDVAPGPMTISILMVAMVVALMLGLKRTLSRRFGPPALRPGPTRSVEATRLPSGADDRPRLSWRQLTATSWDLGWRGTVLVGALLTAIVVVLRAMGYSSEQIGAMLGRDAIPKSIPVAAGASLAAVWWGLPRLAPRLIPGVDRPRPLRRGTLLAAWWSLFWRALLVAVLVAGVLGGIVGGVAAAAGRSHEDISAIIQRCREWFWIVGWPVGLLAGVRFGLRRQLPRLAADRRGLPASETVPIEIPWNVMLAVWWSVVWRGNLLALVSGSLGGASIAAGLLDRGVGPDEAVAILLVSGMTLGVGLGIASSIVGLKWGVQVQWPSLAVIAEDRASRRAAGPSEGDRPG